MINIADIELAGISTEDFKAGCRMVNAQSVVLLERTWDDETKHKDTLRRPGNRPQLLPSIL